MVLAECYSIMSCLLLSYYSRTRFALLESGDVMGTMIAEIILMKVQRFVNKLTVQKSQDSDVTTLNAFRDGEFVTK